LTIRIARGDHGAEVRDLQHRLGVLGHAVSPGEHGVFGDVTEAAVRAFQEARGLRVDGICGPQTWNALVETGFALGDRLLYHREPPLRGDDVADLQRRLSALGFDAGRPDGILGRSTAAALRDFQRNAGIAVDGICGPATLAAVERLSRFDDGSVAALKEREALRAGPRRLAGRKVYLAVEPGLERLADVVGRGIADAGVDLLVHAIDADDSAMAGEANRYGADMFIGLRFGDASGIQCDYYAGARYRSIAGERLAERVLAELGKELGCAVPCPRGRAYGALRETKMTAVVCQPVEAGDPEGMRLLVERVTGAGRAIVRGIRRSFEEPVED
jgi:N-acetylmuramoyl-L-alanine amidase